VKHLCSRILSGTLLLLISSPVCADPIGGIFDVRIAERFSFRTGGTEPFDATFKLRVAFDDGVTDEFDAGDILTQNYGAAHFSQVPLRAAHPPTNNPSILPTFAFTSYTVARASSGEGASFRNGFITRFGENGFEQDFGSYQFQTTLGATERAATSLPLEVTASSLLAFLGRAPTAAFDSPFNFVYSASLRDTNGLFSDDSFRYFGVATTSNPTPEPSTLVLLGIGGLSSVARMRSFSDPGFRRRLQRVGRVSGSSGT